MGELSLGPGRGSLKMFQGKITLPSDTLEYEVVLGSEPRFCAFSVKTETPSFDQYYTRGQIIVYCRDAIDSSKTIRIYGDSAGSQIVARLTETGFVYQVKDSSAYGWVLYYTIFA